MLFSQPNSITSLALDFLPSLSLCLLRLRKGLPLFPVRRLNPASDFGEPLLSRRSGPTGFFGFFCYLGDFWLLTFSKLASFLGSFPVKLGLVCAIVLACAETDLQQTDELLRQPLVYVELLDAGALPRAGSLPQFAYAPFALVFYFVQFGLSLVPSSGCRIHAAFVIMYWTIFLVWSACRAASVSALRFTRQSR